MGWGGAYHSLEQQAAGQDHGARVDPQLLQPAGAVSDRAEGAGRGNGQAHEREQ